MSIEMGQVYRWCVILGIIILPGCGKSGGVQYVPVSGVVTVDGAPLENATILFIPQRTGESTEVGQSSSGRTDEQGRYVLMTASQVRGAAVGHHRVSISTEVSDPSTGEVQVPESLPAKFHKNTTLEIKVPEGGLDSANFNLTTSGK